MLATAKVYIRYVYLGRSQFHDESPRHTKPRQRMRGREGEHPSRTSISSLECAVFMVSNKTGVGHSNDTISAASSNTQYMEMVEGVETATWVDGESIRATAQRDVFQ